MAITNISVVAGSVGPQGSVGPAGPAGGLPMSANSYVIVTVASSASLNGVNLNSAYATASNLTPNGFAKSATNRAYVVLPPAVYNLTGIALNASNSYVDIVGLTGNPNDVVITSSSNSSFTLNQNSTDSKIHGVTIKATGTSSSAYKATGSPTINTIAENCIFAATGSSVSMAAQNYPNTFINCTAGNNAFGSNTNTASGVFTGCTAGQYSFGKYSTGTFTNCNAGTNSFGYGSGSSATGTFRNCVVSGTGFAGSDGATGGTASGTFRNCVAADESFGGTGGLTSGYFVYCDGGPNSFATYSFNGATLIYCIADAAVFP
jgi:hypothetical protein